MKNESKKRIVFLCSGDGGNLRFAKFAADNNWLGQSDVVAVLTDRECGASAFARRHNIPEKCIDFTGTGQSELIESLDFYKPDIVITTVHRILNDEVVSRFRGRLINLHYSLLPAFGGVIGSKPVKNALAYGAKFVGITIHQVDETVDGGRPLMQVAIPVKKFDEVDNLMELLFRCGCLSLGSVLKAQFHQNSDQDDTAGEVIAAGGRQCLFSNKIGLPLDIHDESFWNQIKP